LRDFFAHGGLKGAYKKCLQAFGLRFDDGGEKRLFFI